MHEIVFIPKLLQVTIIYEGVGCQMNMDSGVKTRVVLLG